MRAQRPPLAGLELVVVHPDGSPQVVVRDIVRQAGARSVRILPTGRQAIELVRREKGDVVIVDEHARDPGPLTIAEALGTVLRARPLPAAILMTSTPTRQIIEEALAHGFGSVVAKPFSVRTLIAHVDHAFATLEMRRRNLADRVMLD